MRSDCKHCGEVCENDYFRIGEDLFCCLGCKTVYEIIHAHQLDNFYEINSSPGIKPEKANPHKFDFLDAPNVQESLLDYSEEERASVRFYIPVIHCTSCVYLLETLPKINPAIIQASVDYNQKEVQILFHPKKIQLSDLATFLTQLGYQPAIHLNDAKKEKKKVDHRLLIRLVVAGFCFGNIMLLALPEYLDSGEYWLEKNKNFFRYLMLLLSLPVLFYAASDYFLSAYNGLKNKRLNIDLPIALGIFVLFARSIYDVFTDTSPGYFDSMAGLVFFMLIGKWFQQITYRQMAFDRDYRSFYPLAVLKIANQIEETVLISNLKIGDRIRIRNEELIPADAILMKGDARLDTSFITGEAEPIKKNIGDKVFSGSKQMGMAIELEIIKEVDQSYLTRLWQQKIADSEKNTLETLTEKVTQYFVAVILAITVAAGIFWWRYDASQVWLIVSAILIVACPCALALSAPFIFGNAIRILARKNIFVKNIQVLERLAKIDTIFFDKTGTLTKGNFKAIQFMGDALSDIDSKAIGAICAQSLHPLSQAIAEKYSGAESLNIQDYQEFKGSGISGVIGEDFYALGSFDFLKIYPSTKIPETIVAVAKNHEFFGYFTFTSGFRNQLKSTIEELRNYHLRVISGDNNSEELALRNIFDENTTLYFQQMPHDKVEKIHQEQKKGRAVMMLGDGLNDAGALSKSDVGVAITESNNQFSPACDVIMDAKRMYFLPQMLSFSKYCNRMVWGAFIISFMYNVVGLSFAIAGLLSPIVAAILMPISSISVVIFATFSTQWKGYQLFGRNEDKMNRSE